MKPGTKVKLLIETWLAESGATGMVHSVNLTPGLISVKYDEEFSGIVFDFKEASLEVLD